MPVSNSKIEAMTTGGEVLGTIRDQLASRLAVGRSFGWVEEQAQTLIAQAGMRPSFSTVPGYSWATCIMKNDEVCHGIPSAQKYIEDGDVITLDIGLIHQGYHVDTTTTVVVGTPKPGASEFLAVGQKALSKAIHKVVAGATVYDISSAMQKVLDQAGFGAVYQLTGHGIGEQLHMAPAIPVAKQRSDKKVILQEGQTLAVEVMYTQGKPDLVLAKDGWTYCTKDGSLAGMFEETVLVTTKHPVVLTNRQKFGIIHIS